MKGVKSQLFSFYRHCPHCGTKFHQKNYHGQMELVCPSCGFINWLNSKPTASCILTNNNGDILLTKRAISPFKDQWDVPGGFLELGEHPTDGVKREIKEELGIDLSDVTLLGIYMDTYQKDGQEEIQATLNVYYISRILHDIKLNPQDDVSEAVWFSKNALPKNIAFQNGRDALTDYLKQF